jgi:hypothetical protein
MNSCGGGCGSGGSTRLLQPVEERGPGLFHSSIDTGMSYLPERSVALAHSAEERGQRAMLLAGLLGVGHVSRIK